MSRYSDKSDSSQTKFDGIEIKSKFDAEFRRFSLDRENTIGFEEFKNLLENLHALQDIPFIICYTDPVHGDLLPVNNDDNYARALTTAKPLLRVFVQRKGEIYDVNGYGGVVRRAKNPIISKLTGDTRPKPHIQISFPEDFRRVSAIIDVDVVPETCRRVKLMKNGSDKPLGFYIRDGTSVRVTAQGLEKVPGIFISRLVPGGLAESTGLLAVNDEVLEVNGIEVAGKTLDQVTDMMVANSSNLIITVKPVNQRTTLAGPHQRGSRIRQSNMSQLSASSSLSKQSFDSDDIQEYHPAREHPDEDEVDGDEEGEVEEVEGEEEDDDDVYDHTQESAEETSVGKVPEEEEDNNVVEKETTELDEKDSAVVTL